MLVFPTNPVGVDLFSYVNTFFCVNKFAYMQIEHKCSIGNNYRKLKEPFLPRPQKMQVRISTCLLYMYLIHFICFGFFSKVRATVHNTRLTSNISKLKRG